MAAPAHAHTFKCTTLTQPIYEHVLKFSFTCYNALQQINKNKLNNNLSSPMLIESMLAMLALATSGEAQREIYKALNVPNSATLRSIFRTVFQNIPEIGKEETSMSFTFFLKDINLKVDSDYFEQIHHIFGTKLKQIDFHDRERATADINDWVKRESRGCIKTLIARHQIDFYTCLLLVNIINLQVQWDAPFAPIVMGPQPFIVNDKMTVHVPTLRFESISLKSIREPDWSALCIEVAIRGSKLAMLIFFPQDCQTVVGMMRYIHDVKDFKDLRSSLKKATCNLEIPECSLRATIDLKNTLIGMGVRRIFIAGHAEMTNIFEEKYSPLCVTDVTQSVCVDFVTSEDRVKRAACMLCNCAETIKINKSFFYILVNEASLPLIMGNYMNPS